MAFASKLQPAAMNLRKMPLSAGADSWIILSSALQLTAILIPNLIPPTRVGTGAGVKVKSCLVNLIKY